MGRKKDRRGFYLKRDKKHLWHPLTQHKTAASPLGMVKAKGALFWDEDGKEYIEYHQRMKGINPIALSVKAKQYGNPFKFYEHLATTTEKEKMVLNPAGSVSFEYKNGRVRTRAVGEFARYIKY